MSNLKNIVRKIRLSKLGCYNIADSEKELFDFIEDNFFNLQQKIYNDGKLTFKKGNKFIFTYHNECNTITLNYYSIWSYLKDIYVFETINQRTDLIKDVIKDLYKINVKKISYFD